MDAHEDIDDEDIMPYEINENSDNEIEEGDLDDNSSNESNNLEELNLSDASTILNDKQTSKKIKLNIFKRINYERIDTLKTLIKSEFLLIKSRGNDLGKEPSIKREFLYDDNYYRNLVFNGQIDDVKNIKIELELIHSRMKEKMDLWNFFRYHISSMKKTKLIGIQMYYLVKDKTTNKYLGIISLSSDFSNLTERDKYIGWDHKLRNRKLKHIMNISTCIPLQPFGFNFTGGKLLAMLAFSKEISNDFLEKISLRQDNPQKYPILAINTTSLYGKSIQYSGLTSLKYLGNTKGWSSLSFTDKLFGYSKELLDLLGVDYSANAHRRSKFSICSYALFKSGINKFDIRSDEYQRGIYFGYLYPNSNELLLNENITDEEINNSININNLKSVDEIFNIWYEKYAIKRDTHLGTHKKRKKTVNFFITRNEKNNVYQSTHLNKKIETLGKLLLQDTEKKITPELIKSTGEKKLREIKRLKYDKTKLTDKYDISLLATMTYNNKKLETYAKQIPALIEEDPFINMKDLETKLQISYDSIRSIMDKCKF